MARNKTLSSIILLTTSFIGGITAGLLLAPKSGKRNRQWLAQQSHNFTDWVNSQSIRARKKGDRELQKIRSSVTQGIHQNIPDPYKATEHIELSKNDVSSE